LEQLGPRGRDPIPAARPMPGTAAADGEAVGFFDSRSNLQVPGTVPAIRWPSEDSLPGVVAEEVLLGKSASAAVAVGRFLGYPTGFGFTLLVRLVEPPTRVRLRTPDGGFRFANSRFPRSLSWGRQRRLAGLADLPADLLRVGVVFSDGRTVTNLDADGVGSGAPAGELNAQLELRGGGGLRQWDFEVWVQPLPPPGRLGLVCEWPAKGLRTSRAQIDASRVLEAAARAVGAPTFV